LFEPSMMKSLGRLGMSGADYCPQNTCGAFRLRSWYIVFYGLDRCGQSVGSRKLR
jgi:hypothetical protein